VCDFARCRETLLPLSTLKPLLESGKVLFTEYVSYGTAALSLVGKEVKTVYASQIEEHVDALMQSELVQQYIQYFEFVEGKVHVFLYFAWKDTPRIVLKIAREIKYLAFFFHWKGTQCIQQLALFSRKGLVSAGLPDVDLSILESVFKACGAGLIMIMLVSIKKQLRSLITWICGTIWYILTLPFWIVTKPLRMAWGACFASVPPTSGQDVN
jgi:hypothetical protein